MHDSDVNDFKEQLEAMMGMFNKEVSLVSRRMWWASLSPYSLQQVKRAFRQYIDNEVKGFAPAPGAILQLIRGESGHLSPEEAWALALESTDESVTVVWTEEIAQALSSASPCLDAGDKFGARQAFVTAYEKNVRKAHPVPVWTVSAGYDASHRQLALQSAVDAGRLTHESVAHLLPAPEANKAIAGLLTGKVTDTTGLDPRWKELGDKLRASQQAAADNREAERLARDAEFTERRWKALTDLGAAHG